MRTLEDLGPGDHLCCLYQTEEEHRALLTPFLRHGLERGEKTIYIMDVRTADVVHGYLRDDGIDVESYLEKRQLSIIGFEDAYMKAGVFDPDGMIALLREQTERALAEGYSALRVTCEMTWALRDLPGSERLMEYEVKLNEFFPQSKCLAICQYDRRHFEAGILLDVVATHPLAVIGAKVVDNFYYQSPTDLLGPDPQRAELERRLDNLIAREHSEEAMGKTEERYRTLVARMNEGLSIIDEHMVIKYANKRFLRMIGYSEDETLGRPVTDFCDETNQKILLGQFEKRKKGGRSRYEVEFTGKNGRQIPTLVSPEPIFEDGGGFKGAFAVTTDISDLKQREKELEISRSNLEEANTALHVLLEMREEDKTELEEKVLVNMRRLVLPVLEKLKASPLDARQSAYLDILESNLNAIVSPFLHRLSARHPSLTPTEIQVANLIKEGKTTKEIGEVMTLSPRTIETHRKNIRKKLGIKKKRRNLRSQLMSFE